MTTVQNDLIDLMLPGERERLLAVCEPVQLVLSDVVCRPGESLSHVYFPVDGFISLVADTDGRPGLEVGMIGREGMLGAHLLLGVDRTPLRGVVQGAGRAWRADALALHRLLSQSAALRSVLGRYVYVLMAQLASSAACQRFHAIEPRLARWLLMSQDRAHSSDFRMTQAFLAYMLGVRRVGITSAARMLQDRGLIRYVRGSMSVLDRPGLEAVACSCYAADEEVYAQQLGSAAGWRSTTTAHHADRSPADHARCA
ncbi:MAG TPA: Crp/Fnr family transcriptional regulator [Variovorax sp.]|nr:Crp/Fnr family transcriptional regulator [Variovorax sp.]